MLRRAIRRTFCGGIMRTWTSARRLVGGLMGRVDTADCGVLTVIEHSYIYAYDMYVCVCVRVFTYMKVCV